MKTFKEVRAPKIKKGLRDKKGKIHTVTMNASGRKLEFKVTDEFGSFKTVGVKQLAKMFESTESLNEVTDKEINAVKKLSKDIEKVKKDYFKIAKMGDKTLQSTKYNKKYESILKAQQDVLKLIGDLSNQKMMQKESVEELSEMAVSRKDFDKIKKNDVIEFVFDSSMKKGHKVKLKVKSKTRSNKYNVDKINMVDATDPRNKTKFTLFSRGGKDATLGWGGMGVVIKSYKVGVKEGINEDGQYVSPNQMTDKQKQDHKDRIQRDRERRLKRMKAGQQDSKDDMERKKKERERNLRTFAGRKEAVSPAQQAAIAISKKEKEQKECKDEKDFKPHMMYDPKTGKGVKANTYADHVKLDKMGYTHEPVKEQNCGCGKTPCETYGKQNEARGYGKKPVSMMTPAEKKKDAERRKAYNAFQKKNRKEDMEEAMNPKDKAKRLAMIKKAVEKINARNAEKAKKDALKMMKDSGMFDESVVTEAKASNIDQIRNIVKTKGAKKVGGVMVDMFTASAIVKVYDAINDTNKAKMDKMTVPAMANVAFKLMKK